MAKGPVSPTRSKTSEITMFHVTMMTTIPVHRLGTPRESQITPIIQEFKRQLQNQNTVIFCGQEQWLFNLHKPSLKVVPEYIFLDCMNYSWLCSHCYRLTLFA